MMFFKLSASSKVKRILVVSLSNVGDVVLTLPVVDALRSLYPEAGIYMVVGPKAISLFGDDPRVVAAIPYDKRMSGRELLDWYWKLRGQRFDLVVDLRNSFLPFLLNTGAFTSPLVVAKNVHMKEKHLCRLRSVVDLKGGVFGRHAVMLSAEDRGRVDRLLEGMKDFVLVAPGAANNMKRWPEENFISVIKFLRLQGRQIVLVGDRHDSAAAARIMGAVPDGGVLDLCGKTTLLELAGIAERTALALTNDSGVMHLVSYFDRPVVALFGPTSPFFYGPWSARSIALRKGLVMDAITPEDVVAALGRFL